MINMKKIQKITVQGLKIVIFKKSESDFISLTDIARFKNAEEPKEIVKNWI